MYLSYHMQAWDFYVITLCLFVVLSSPSIVWKYFWVKF
jgi:hypothetical protein